MTVYCWRDEEHAARNRGNHPRGALTSRPSANRTWRASSVTVTATASDSILMAEELIPALGDASFGRGGQRALHQARVHRGDTEQGQGRTVWNAPTLLPIL